MKDINKDIKKLIFDRVSNIDKTNKQKANNFIGSR